MMLKLTENEITQNWGDYDIDKPVVSIRCTAYNHEKYIAQCLDGFLMQKTNFPFEIVVNDDASTDKTADIIREYELKYPNIVKPIYQVENQYSKQDGSLKKILNSKMRGKYIAICEGDDYWLSPEKLQKQYDALETHPECTIAYARVRFVDVNGNSLNYTAPPYKYVKEGTITLKEFIDVEFGKATWCFQTSSFFVRTEAFFNYYKIHEKMVNKFPYGDIAIVLYTLIQGKGYFVDLEQGCYRMMSGGYNSLLKKNSEIDVKDNTKLINALEEFDKFTEYKYHKNIQHRIANAYLHIEICMAKDKKAKNKIFLKIKYFKIVGIKQKIKSIAYLCSPILYNKLKNKKTK